jgi:hypothetical protein
MKILTTHSCDLTKVAMVRLQVASLYLPALFRLNHWRRVEVHL